MRYIFLFVSLLTPFYLSAQVSITGQYSLSNIKSDLTAEIFLYANGKYEIFIDKLEEVDGTSSLLISLGSCRKSDNLLFLYDNYNNYSMSFVVNSYNNSITGLKTFDDFKNKIFIKEKLQISDNSVFNIGQFTKLFLELNLFDIKNVFSKKITYGDFSGNGLTLRLKTNHTFSLKYKNVCLFKGNFILNKNRLELFDKNLNHCFFALIESENSLICKFFPGDNKYFVLNKEFQSK